MMKIITTLCLVLLSVHSYSQEVIPEVETVTRDGLIYHQLSTEPLTGTVVSFFADGRLRTSRNYIDGKSDGLYEQFYDNGQLRERGNWIDGEFDGLYERFYENGQLEMRGNYQDGKSEGLFEWFDENGRLAETRTYRSGELVK